MAAFSACLNQEAGVVLISDNPRHVCRGFKETKTLHHMMTRLLLFLIDGRTGGVGVEFGKVKEMRKALREHRATAGNSALVHTVRGPDVNIQALDVLWTLQDDHLEKRHEQPGGLQSLILEVLLIGATRSEELKRGLQTSTLRAAGARIPGYRSRIPR